MPSAPSALRRFPLVRRFRPPCPPLPNRIAELRRLAHLADQQGDIRKASSVYNLAALVATDSGLPHLARELCWQHANLYLQHRPLSGQWACLAVEPLVNLAQLHNRLGNGDLAFQLLTNLHLAATTGCDTTLDDTPLPAASLTRTPEDRQQLREWAEGVYCQDGARALVAAGQWGAAHAHLQRQHVRTGSRMFESRQIAAIAFIASGDTAEALNLIHETEPGEPWEQAVTACLEAQGDARAFALALDAYRHLDLVNEHVVFHTRLGLSLIDTAAHTGHGLPNHHATALIAYVLDTGDGYAARDVLDHPGCAELLDSDRLHALRDTVTLCGLSHDQTAGQLREHLAEALDVSAAVINRTLADRARADYGAGTSAAEFDESG
ncbi:hypothetical protein [Streptomyces sp. UNOC14_S4]|uniref:hypothetical protein n=1 Tax=Streptomyces sp. UNOC14_S4 TaxID=2872340 RepID=UPI001E583EF3|nr:hypothetical protein [Streptomyces sp. UNOC14_S4]MCC3767571.1 hypothetical protein [Streptomyces sp. UNOC14_S4]